MKLDDNNNGTIVIFYLFSKLTNLCNCRKLFCIILLCFHLDLMIFSCGLILGRLLIKESDLRILFSTGFLMFLSVSILFFAASMLFFFFSMTILSLKHLTLFLYGFSLVSFWWELWLWDLKLILHIGGII